MVGAKFNEKVLVAGLLLLLFTGCTNHFTSLSMVSTRPDAINIDGYETVQENAVGKDRFHMIVLFPTGTVLLERAVEDALAKSGGDLLVNVRAETFWFYIPYIYGQTVLTVRGDALKRKKNGLTVK